MALLLTVDEDFVTLSGESVTAGTRRPLVVAALHDIATKYAPLREAACTDALRDLGIMLFDWLSGAEGWLDPLPGAPFVLEIRSRLIRPGPNTLAVLQAPWEVLATAADGFLAADPLLDFQPVRRLGPAGTMLATDGYRLGVAFMVGAPRGGGAELDFEAEEAAIDQATSAGIDLIVEDSGDPDELGRRLSALDHPPPVLHLSCHGHNAWRFGGQPPQPALALEESGGALRPTTAAALKEALRNYSPHLVFLSACLTASDGPAAQSLAQALIAGGVPAVLGWDGSVADNAAIAFAHRLYDGLASGMDVGKAAARARRGVLHGEALLPASPHRETLQLAPADRQNWHMARVWLDAAGGGPVCRGTLPRSPIPANQSFTTILARKGDEELVVPNAALFVGRRRDLQTALRLLAEPKPRGLLLHGMGRLGKTSLAARIASRRSDLKLAVVFARYDALSILTALEEALTVDEAACAALMSAKQTVQDSPAALERALINLLSGPCAAAGSSVLLLIDDLERILEARPDARHQVRAEERPVIAAVLRAFANTPGRNRLIVTSRFRFTLAHNGHDLADTLHPRGLAEFPDTTRRKLTRRLTEAARKAAGSGGSDDAGRQKLLARAELASAGNPGLQSFIQSKIVLNPLVPLARAELVLAQMEAYRASGAAPADEATRQFLEKIGVTALLDLAGAAGQALLRACLLFRLPVPKPAIAALAAALGGDPERLCDLGLLEPSGDIFDSTALVLSPNSLATRALPPLSPSDEPSLATIATASLFTSWGSPTGGPRRATVLDIELTRLGVLAGDPLVLACCAGDAIQAMRRRHDPEAGPQATAAVAILEHHGVEPPLRLLAYAASAVRHQGDGDGAGRLLDKASIRLANRQDELDPNELSHVLSELGDHQIATGQVDKALANFEKLRDAERALGRAGENNFAVAQGKIADIMQARGQLDEALAIRTEQELPVYQRLGDIRAIAVTQGKIADIMQARGQLDEALAIRTEQEFPVYQRLGDIRAIAVTQGKIADIMQARGQLDEALAILTEQELPVFQRLGDIRELAITQGKIADIMQARGQLDEALAIRTKQELPVFQRLGDIRAIAVTQGKIADIMQARGQLDEALAIRTEQQLPVFQRLGDIRELAITQGKIAQIYAMRGDWDATRTLQEQRLASNRQMQDADGIAAAQWDIAQISLQREDMEDAAPRLVEAWSIVAAMGRAKGVAVIGELFGQMLAANGLADEGLAILTQSATAYRLLG